MAKYITHTREDTIAQFRKLSVYDRQQLLDGGKYYETG